MPVDPLLAPFLAGAAPTDSTSGSAASVRRAAHAAMEAVLAEHAAADSTTVAKVDHLAPVNGTVITVRLYVPHGEPPFPLHVYMHGGGFSRGLLAHFDAECRYLCEHAGCYVASIDYRLSPEHKYPTARLDCFAALEWLMAKTDELGVDSRRVSVGGVSAGANLAAAVALDARDRGGPPIRFQVLEIPLLDLTLAQPSVDEFGTGFGLTRAALEQVVADYLADPADATDPLASPLLARELRGLPDALVMTAECDPLRDQGRWYAGRLREAGVQAELVEWQGHIHGAASFTKLLPSARAYRDHIAAALRRVFARPSGQSAAWPSSGANAGGAKTVPSSVTGPR